MGSERTWCFVRELLRNSLVGENFRLSSSSPPAPFLWTRRRSEPLGHPTLSGTELETYFSKNSSVINESPMMFSLNKASWLVAITPFSRRSSAALTTSSGEIQCDPLLECSSHYYEGRMDIDPIETRVELRQLTSMKHLCTGEDGDLFDHGEFPLSFWTIPYGNNLSTTGAVSVHPDNLPSYAF